MSDPAAHVLERMRATEPDYRYPWIGDWTGEYDRVIFLLGCAPCAALDLVDIADPARRSSVGSALPSVWCNW